MTLAPFIAAPMFIKVHIVSALTVVALSPLQFWGLRKGSMAHRVAGYGWLLAMLLVAISSFWIKTNFPLQIMGYGPIHLLSLLALYSSVMIPLYARKHNVIAHRKTVRGLSIGFWLAAVFTFMPPRIMWQMLVG